MATVFTMGYEGTDINRFLATLKIVGIECLADVRAVPHSRKKGFSKKSLSDLLQANGIRYRHFLPLGDPKPGRDAARAGDFDTFRSIYTDHLALDDSQASLEDLLKVVEGQKTCLLCFERDPKTCHRSIIAQSIVSRGHESFELYGDDPTRYERHAARLPGGGAGKGASPS
jgi:uncharacterized protein (DUF488 family)